MRTDVEERLKKYRSKRDFRRTDEPAGEGNIGAGGRLYVMHKHAASHDHFDLRLEQDGVLRSWALPKGPSLTPGEKRLAIEVEDHPLDYGSFEGFIPQGEYGGGTVMLWDAGSWRVTSSDEQRIDFELDGEKLRGALLLGAYEGDRLRYAGRVGTGFSTLQLRQLHKTLKALQANASPFDDAVAATATTWVKPTLVVEVEFTERTRDGRLRHPVFRGVREDRKPEEIMLIPAELGTTGTQQQTRNRSKPVRRGATKQSTETVAGIVISHPQRVLYPEQGLSKLDLAHYYAEVGEWMLPQLARRPLSLLRCPDSASDTCFYQKHLGPAAARQVPRIAIASEQGEGDYCYVETVSDIVALVQAGVLEMHPWGCHVDDIEHPDQLVFDLDPGPGVEWRRVVATARALRELLAELGLHSFARTTGGKGLHLVVPLKPHLGWDETKAFSHAVVELLASADPRHLTTNMAKASRKGRIFLDYLRNGRGNTAVASYSARARPGAPVAVPIRWEELNATMQPDRYRVDNLKRRLSALKCDPWIDFEQQRVAITDAILKKVSNVEK